jgi:carbonic anhydrase
MQRLLDGYRHFRATGWPQHAAELAALAREGQHPVALIIACADSRIDPNMIFGAVPGDLFIVRNVANLVPAFAPDRLAHSTSAALEFAVRVLDVPNVVVMGHAGCGGIRALLEGPPEDGADFLEPWMRIAEAARNRALAYGPADKQTACEHEAIKLSLGNLMTFPWIAERVTGGRLALHGMSFDISTGELTQLGHDGVFRPVA